MTRGWRAFLIGATGLALLLAAFSAWVVLSDHAWVRDDVEQALTDALGREVRIDGGLQVDIGLSSVLVIEGFSIAAPDWSAEKALLSLQRAVIVIDTLSVISETLVVEALTVDGLQLALENDPEHGTNWQIPVRTESPPKPKLDDELPFRIEDLEMESSGVRYVSPALGRTLVVTIDRLQQSMAPDASAALYLHGAVNDAPLELRINFDDMVALSALRDVEVNFDGSVGEIRMDGYLDIDDLSKPRRPTARIEIEGPGGKYLGDLLHIPDLDSGDLTVDFGITPEGDRMRVDLDATIARFRLTGDGFFDDLETVSSAEANVMAEGPNAARFASLFGLEGIPAQAYTLAARAGIEGRKVDISEFDARLGPTTARGTARFEQIPHPDGAEVDLHVTGPAIEDFGRLTGLGERLRGPFEFDLDMAAADGGGATVGLHLDAAGARLDATGPVQRGAARLDVSLAAANAEATLRHLRLPVTRIPPEPVLLAGNFEFSDDRFRFEDWRATLGDTEAGFKASIDNRGKTPVVRMEGSLTGTDLSTWLPALAGKLGGAGDFDLRSTLSLQAARVGLEKLDGRIGHIELSANGEIATDDAQAGSRLDIRAGVKDISRWSEAVGHELPAEPASLDVTLASVASGMEAEKFEARLGPNRVSGQLDYRREPEQRIRLALSADELALGPYLPQATGDPASGENAAGSANSGRVIPDAQIPMPPPAWPDATVTLDVAEMALRNRTYRDIHGDLRLEDGRLAIERFEILGTGGGRFSGRASLVPVPSGSRLVVVLAGSGVRIGLPAATPEDYAALPTYSVDLGIAANGTTVREMTADLDGYLRLHAFEGRVRTGSVRILSQDFVLQLLETINPFFREDPYASLECLVVQSVARDGIVTGKPILLARSDKIQVVADARINLADETLEADINTVARKGLGISLGDLINPYIKISGTLAAPKLILDPRQALFEGGAAVATGGLSILAKNLYGRFFSGSNPCQKVLDESSAEFEELEDRFHRLLVDGIP